MKITTVKKIKIGILGDSKEEINEKYKFIRDSQYAQYRAMNVCMGWLVAGYQAGGMNIKSEPFKHAQERLKNLRKETLNDESYGNIQFGQGIETAGMVYMKVKQDFSIALKNGLARGERTATNYKRTYPLMASGRSLKFGYVDNNVIIKWVNGIKFKVIMTNSKNATELKHTLHKVINKEYKVCQSSIMFNSKNEMILNLTLQFEKDTTIDFIKGRTLGVDLGIKYPAYACLSDETFIRKSFGSADDFLRVRLKMRDERRRLQQALTLTRGGRGRKKKLKPLTRFQEKERNWAKTYNHTLSSKIIKFATEHQCEYINLEDLNKNGFDNKILGLWSYYELQQMIQYKADRVGIKVRKVDPAYTSQTCSRCGCIDKENRQSQAKFECTECGLKLNADHNASINIAKAN